MDLLQLEREIELEVSRAQDLTQKLSLTKYGGIAEKRVCVNGADSMVEKTDNNSSSTIISEEERAQREEENFISGLLKLSPELRNRIYQDTIPTTTRISVVSRVDQKQISLLQLCRAIRNETVPIFYGNTTFTFDLRSRHNFQRAKSWLEGLSPEAVRSLRKIYIQSDVNCCCKEFSKNEKPTHLHAWVDLDAGKWSQYGYSGCKCCSSQAGAKDVVRKISLSCAEQKVRKEDLSELLEILRPIRAYDFSFAVAKDGEGKATFETRPRVFGSAPSTASVNTSPIRENRHIKQLRRRQRVDAKEQSLESKTVEMTVKE